MVTSFQKRRLGVRAIGLSVGLAAVIATPVVVSASVIKEIPTASVNASPQDITRGPDGALWFTEAGAGALGRIVPSQAPTDKKVVAGGTPTGITVGPDGALWFTDPGTNSIGRMTTTGVVTEFSLGTTAKDPERIATGPDGNLWFIEVATGGIGAMTISGTFREFPVAQSPYQLTDITKGPDGNVWFTEGFVGCCNNGLVGRISPSTGSFTTYGFGFECSCASPARIVTGPDRNLWVSGSGGILRVDTTGTVLPTAFFGASKGLAFDRSGNLWVTDPTTDNIDRVTPGGVVTVFEVPTSGSGVDDIARGPDGTMWFTETLVSQIGRLSVQQAQPKETLSPVSGPPGSHVKASGFGFGQADAISVSFDGSQVAVATATGSGAWSVTFAVPTSAVSGAHTVLALGSSGLAAQTTFTVT